MAKIYKYSRLSDNFESGTGSLTDYWVTYQPPPGPDTYGSLSAYGTSIYHTAATNLLDPITLEPRYHYDLRAFHGNTNRTFTQLDYTFWNGYPYNKMSTYSVGGTRPLGVLMGQETWSAGTVAKNASYRYSDTLTLSVPAVASDTTYGPSTYGSTSFYGQTVTQTIGTYTGDTTIGDPGTYGTATYGVGQYHGPEFNYGDDLTPFQDPTGTHQYYIDILLRNFPSQSTGIHFDLTNSWFDVSSTVDMTPSTTDSFQFSSTLNNVNLGGDTYLRFPLSGIVNADLANIKAVRFRLKSVSGTSTFIVNAVRVVRDDYIYKVVDIDTKRQELSRSLPQAGGTEPSSTFGELYFKNERPRNVTYVAAFNTGHHPTGNDNRLRLFFRTKQNGDRIEVEFTSRDTQSRLQLHQVLNGSASDLAATSINTNILTAETYYYLVVTINDSTVTAAIYNADGPNLGAEVYSVTGTTGVTGNGLVGFSFEPYNYDFDLQFLAPQNTYFAKFQTKSFNSRKLVSGITLYPVSSLPVNVIGDLTPNAWGDATVITDDNGDLVITRKGVENQGGVRWLPPVNVGNTNELRVTGQLWTGNVQGTYRAALLDMFDSVRWIGIIRGLQPNTWNDFELAVTPNLTPSGSSILHIQQSGQYPGSFKLRDVALNYKTVIWNAITDIPSATVADQYSATVLEDGAKAYWKLDESSGTFADATGNLHSGTPNGGITYSVSGQVNTGITLNGTTGYISVANHSDFNTGDVFSLEAWIKPAVISGAQVILNKDANQWRFELDGNGKLGLYKTTAGLIVASTYIFTVDNTWHHVVATKNGSTVKLYVDGNDVTGTVNNQTIVNTSNNISIGGPTGIFFNGSLDEIAIYPTALSSTQVMNHYLAAVTNAPTVPAQPFLDAVGEQYSGVRFVRPVSNFKLQAIATSDLGWIEGYEMVPQYIYTPA